VVPWSTFSILIYKSQCVWYNIAHYLLQQAEDIEINEIKSKWIITQTYNNDKLTWMKKPSDASVWVNAITKTFNTHYYYNKYGVISLKLLV